MTEAVFNFEAFKRAVEGQDVDAWLGFYADDAEWIEYRHKNPPRAPNRMVGKGVIGDFLQRVKTANVRLAISDEVIGKERAAFCLWVDMADGKRIIEHVIVHIADRKIARQVDVEAWDAD